METLSVNQKLFGEYISKEIMNNFSILCRNKDVYNFLFSIRDKTKTTEIIKLANYYKTEYKTRDPFIICKKLEIPIMTTAVKSFKAYTVGISHKVAIHINNNIKDLKSRRILCAHELGHALFHKNGYNEFNDYDQIKEYEANLFAVAFLFDEKDFNMPLKDMSNYILKGILNHNLK